MSQVLGPSGRLGDGEKGGLGLGSLDFGGGCQWGGLLYKRMEKEETKMLSPENGEEMATESRDRGDVRVAV